MASVGDFAGWVETWLRGRGTAWVIQQATAEADLRPAMAQAFPVPLRRFGRGFLGVQGLAALRACGPPEWQEITSRIMAMHGDWAPALWAHEAWFHRQLAQARDLFLAD